MLEIEKYCRGVVDGLPGATTAILVGSHARGVARPESDVDLILIGEGDEYRLEVIDGELVALAWRTAEEQRERFTTAETAVAEIPAWRTSLIIRDDDGLAEVLRQEAVDWSWSLVEDADSHVAASVTGLAEEVHKLVAALRGGRDRVAAVQRALLALQLPMAMAIHFRELYLSENDVWDLVAAAAGEQWRDAQDMALGLGDPTFVAGCRAALRLYETSVALVADLLDDRQRKVTEHTLALARAEMARLAAIKSGERRPPGSPRS